MRVELNLPDKAWAAVLDAAEKDHTTVALFVEAAIRDALRPSHVTKLQAQARRHMILRAHAEGLTDRAIAERTGELVGYIAKVRRDAGLHPNQLRRAS